jgi:soluble lytic murein transglycosylase
LTGVCFSKRAQKRGRAAACALLALAAPLLAPSSAQANSAAADYFMSRIGRSPVPKLLTEDERSFYKDLFASIKRRDWAKVQSLLAGKADGPLHGVALGEYYLAAGSPKVDGAALATWLGANASLPQAEQLAALASKRGVTALPGLPAAMPMQAQPNAPRRTRPRSSTDGTMPAIIASGILDKIKADDATGARVLLDGIDATLSPEARAEWRQKVAWAYYIGNQDGEAFALAASIGDGSVAMDGPWLAEGAWVAGLAAWRLDDCMNAAEAFGRTAKQSTNSELTAAALFWQSRALVRCRQPEAASEPLRAAARLDETLYGMMAVEQLGLKLPATHAAPDFTAQDWQALRETPNVRTAVALAEIGEDALADDVLRHQARLGGAQAYQPLARLARDLGLPATQLWMAYNAPGGAAPAPASRFPTPKWTPATGWQVDPALVLAHTLQESAFRANAVSGAGARGLMQIMPAAARDHAAALGVSGSVSDLTRPDVNLAFGQQHLQALKKSASTQGLLPKVMAAYNAGPLTVARWNTTVRDKGDPLLWMESLPYWETRGYVATVLRNYWMYERQAGGISESRVALAQGQWPGFPGLDGAQTQRPIRVASKDSTNGSGY